MAEASPFFPSLLPAFALAVCVRAAGLGSSLVLIVATHPLKSRSCFCFSALAVGAVLGCGRAGQPSSPLSRLATFRAVLRRGWPCAALPRL